MNVERAYCCLDCGELRVPPTGGGLAQQGGIGRCPACASETAWPVERWLSERKEQVA